VQIIKYNGDHHAFHREIPVYLEAGAKYEIVVNYSNYRGDADIKLLWAEPRSSLIEETVTKSKDVDAIVAVVGLSQRLEGEEMSINIEGFEGGDRTNLKLPHKQRDLISELYNSGKPVILVLMSGSAMAIIKDNEMATAILYAGYGGQQGGNAVADVLFGDYNPAGRLPVTYYRSVKQLPAFENYDMAGRTYRYFEEKPLYPFGYGLSYTTFSYSNLDIVSEIEAGDPISIGVTVTNTGDLEGDEVVQLYLSDEKGSTPRPIRQLEGFSRIHLKQGESKYIQFTLEPRQLSMINDECERVIEPGWFTVFIGGKQPGFEGYMDPPFTQSLSGRFRVTGKETTPVK